MDSRAGEPEMQPLNSEPDMSMRPSRTEPLLDMPPASPKTQKFLKQVLQEEHVDPQASGCYKHLIILPGSATGWWLLEAWDVYISALVLAIAYFEPCMLALYSPRAELAWHAVANLIFNISFTIDMVLQFFISTQHAQDSIHHDLHEKDVRKLAKAYCAIPLSREGHHGWFWVDLITVLPGWYAAWTADIYIGNPLYLLRIVRLFQTARLARIDKLCEVLHARYGYPFFIMDVCKFFLLTTLTVHWMACLWVLVEGRVTRGWISYSTDKESWLSALIKAKGDSCDPDAEHDPMCVLVLAYYWAAMTLTSVGYGDITPQNPMEYALSVVCMLVVGYIWAFIVGTIVSILSNIDPGSVEYKRSLDDLGKLMKRRGLSRQLQVRTRTYMHESRRFLQLYNQRQLLDQYLSDGLQREIAAHSVEVKGMLKNVYWMRELPEAPILDIVRGLQPRAYGPQEYIFLRSSMILMQRGLAGVKGRVIGRGDAWGQNDILMETPQLIDSTMPQTLSFVELLMLAKSTLIEVCHRYPVADRRLRRAQIRTATARGFIYYANRVKSEERQKLKTRTKSNLATFNTMKSRVGVDQSNESSFAHPGLARMDVGGSLENKEDSEWKQLLLELLRKQSLLDQKVSALTEEVRANKSKGLVNLFNTRQLS